MIDLGQGQGNKRRARIPLHPLLRSILEEGLTGEHVVEHGGGRIASVKVGFLNAAMRATLPGATPHVPRHTATTWLAQAGVLLPPIAAHLGNSAATVERVYAHHAPDFMAAASAALGMIYTDQG